MCIRDSHLDSRIVMAFLFDKDIFAYKSIMKVKLKILERASLSFLMLYLLDFEAKFSYLGVYLF